MRGDAGAGCAALEVDYSRRRRSPHLPRTLRLALLITLVCHEARIRAHKSKVSNAQQGVKASGCRYDLRDELRVALLESLDGLPKVRFAIDSLLERAGFEPSVPRFRLQEL